MWETWGWGGAGWLAGGRAGLGVCGCGRAVGLGRGVRGGRGSLGSGATRPWLLPWPPQRLPPPVEGKSGIPAISLNWTSIWSEKHNILLMVGGGGRMIRVDYAPRWSWPRRSQSGFPRWPRPLRSPSPSLSSCPPSYRSQPFLSAVWKGKAGCAITAVCHQAPVKLRKVPYLGRLLGLCFGLRRNWSLS